MTLIIKPLAHRQRPSAPGLANILLALDPCLAQTFNLASQKLELVSIPPYQLLPKRLSDRFLHVCIGCPFPISFLKLDALGLVNRNNDAPD